MIRNDSLHTHVFFNGLTSIPIYPGINLLDQKTEKFLLCDERVQLFLQHQIFTHADAEDLKIYHDKQTDMDFIETTGKKLPVSTEGRSPNPVPEVLDSPKSHYFKAQQLKKLGLSPESITEIISKTPESGYSNISQLPETITDSERDIVASLFD